MILQCTNAPGVNHDHLQNKKIMHICLAKVESLLIWCSMFKTYNSCYLLIHKKVVVLTLAISTGKLAFLLSLILICMIVMGV